MRHDHFAILQTGASGVLSRNGSIFTQVSNGVSCIHFAAIFHGNLIAFWYVIFIFDHFAVFDADDAQFAIAV